MRLRKSGEPKYLRGVDNVLNIGNVLRQVQVSVLLDSDIRQVDGNDRVCNEAVRR